MAPPQLPRYAPVVDVVHPFEIGLGPAFGDEARRAVFHGGHGRFGQGANLHIPLIGQVRLYGGAGALAPGYHQVMLFNFFNQPQGLQVLLDLPARRVPVQAPVRLRPVVVDGGVRREDVEQRQLVSLSHLVVIEIMGRRDLDATAAEGRVHIVVGDHRQFASGQGQLHHQARQAPVSVVLRVDRHRRVPQHGLGPRGRHHDMALAVGAGVAQMPEFPLFLFGLHLQIGDSGAQHRIPVHQTLAPVDQTLVVEANEHLPHGAGEALIHGEAFAGPVHGGAQAARLPGDGVA